MRTKSSIWWLPRNEIHGHEILRKHCEKNLGQRTLLPAAAAATAPRRIFRPAKGSFIKSDNLQYNKLGHWVAGMNDSSTKCLMFKVLFSFFIKFEYSEKATKVCSTFHFLFDIT